MRFNLLCRGFIIFYLIYSINWILTFCRMSSLHLKRFSNLLECKQNSNKYPQQPCRSGWRCRDPEPTFVIKRRPLVAAEGNGRSEPNVPVSLRSAARSERTDQEAATCTDNYAHGGCCCWLFVLVRRGHPGVKEWGGNGKRKQEEDEGEIWPEAGHL